MPTYTLLFVRDRGRYEPYVHMSHGELGVGSEVWLEERWWRLVEQVESNPGDNPAFKAVSPPPERLFVRLDVAEIPLYRGDAELLYSHLEGGGKPGRSLVAKLDKLIAGDSVLQADPEELRVLWAAIRTFEEEEGWLTPSLCYLGEQVLAQVRRSGQ